jgi:hypothetical protein
MEVISYKKNDLRNALLEFYLRLIGTLSDSKKETKVKDLKRVLVSTSNDIKKQYRHSSFKDDIRKALKGEIRDTLILARDIAEGNHLQNGKLLYDLFDGIP